MFCCSSLSDKLKYMSEIIHKTKAGATLFLTFKCTIYIKEYDFCSDFVDLN